MPNLYPFIDASLGEHEEITVEKPELKDCWYGWCCKMPENIFLVFKHDVPGGMGFVITRMGKSL